MGNTKLTVRIQNYGNGLIGGLDWRDVTTDCKQIRPNQGLEGPRGFMPRVGTCEYLFKNDNNAYSPIPNRENPSAYILDVGRRIQHLVTLPTHGKALRVTYGTGVVPNAGYFGQTVTATTTTKDRWTLEFEARCESGFLRNTIRAELRTNAPEVCEGQVFEITRKWRVYRLTFIAQSNATTVEARFYNIFTGDETNFEFRNMSLTTSAGGSNKFTNPTFTSGSTGWSGSGAGCSGIDDYDVKFDGIIHAIYPAPFTLGENISTVVAVDWVSALETSTAKFALQKNKRADELIATIFQNLPAAYWVQAPPGLLLAKGHQTFDRSFTDFTERETTLYDAIAASVESENGIFWCDLDGTFRFENNTFHSRRARREGIPRPAWHIFQANPADGDQIAIWSETYRFKNTPVAAYDVKIGATAKDTALNLTNAINMDAATLGSSYHSATPIHSQAEASYLDYKTAVLADAPATYLRLGEAAGVSAADASGNAHTSTYVNGVTLGATGALPSDSDKGVTLDGVNDFISTPTIPLYFTSFSVEMWLKAAAAPPATQDVFSAFSAFVKDQAFYIRINSNGSITVDFYLDSFTTGASVITFGGSLYQHLVVTYDKDADLLTIYVNGLQVGQASIGYFDSTTSPTITFGGFPAAGTTPYKGSMDDAALYLKALSPSRVAIHYAARYAAVALIKYRNTNQTAELVLAEGTANPYTMRVVRSAETVINKCTITWTPRQTVVALTALAQIQSPVQIPPRSNGTNMSFVKPGYSNPVDGRVGTQELTLTFRDATGNTIAGDNVLDPVATTDYKIFEFPDPAASGYEYTTQTQYFWISDIVKSASQFTCKLNNNALGALYATMFQVRGNAVYSYDEQEAKGVNQNSINLYRERQLRRSMPFTNDQQFCQSLADYTVERYGTPFVEAEYIETESIDMLNGTYLLSLNLMDTVVITDTRSALFGVRHMIVGVSAVLVPNQKNYVERIRFTLERLDQNQYFILSDATYGVVGGDSRLYI